MTIELKGIHPSSAEALAGFRAGRAHFGNEKNPDPHHDAEEIEKEIRKSLDREDPHVLAWDGSEVVGESCLRRVHFEGMGHTAGLSVKASGPFQTTEFHRTLADAVLQRCRNAEIWRVEFSCLSSDESGMLLARELNFQADGCWPRARIIDDRVEQSHHFSSILEFAPEVPEPRPDPVSTRSRIGGEVQIIDATLSHAESLHAILDQVAMERRWIGKVRSPGVDRIRSFIKANRESGHPHLIAVQGDRVLGWIDIIRYREKGAGHIGGLGMGLDPACRGMGLGTRLMEEALEAARTQGLLQVSLEVYANNQAGCRLYRRSGFEETVLRRRIRRLDGHEEDLLGMSRSLD